MFALIIISINENKREAFSLETRENEHSLFSDENKRPFVHAVEGSDRSYHTTKCHNQRSALGRHFNGTTW